ncbi:autotransporter outer membrane beta-barrel domain-containing protein [Phyllobacterium sp.]|uniref:autotransporter family protein n=1 Tax=unclassified Phyllobacterium TaxID=2638441 RepID=UPI001AD3BF01|nr:autotransporter outer membrane beta-barrel domain-containing protein [Phyllobacterium sp.]MBQ9349667.1 autotransporter outer membrane beta-barrel domain-containing protein [Phyllobacterium sp.]
MRFSVLHTRFLSLFTTTALISIASPTIGWAACSSLAPVSGQTVTCDTSAPNPATAGVHAVAGSSGVNVNIGSGAQLNIVRSPTENSGVSVVDGSTVVNNGAISLTGSGSTGLNRGAGLVGTGSNNSLTNNGSISTTNQYNDGMAADGSGNTLTNNGTITTTGPNAYGMTASWGQSGGGSPNNTLINNGTVTTNGSNARAASILGQNGTVINTGTLTTTGNSAPTVYMQGTNARLTNSGVIHAQGGAASGGLPSDGVFSNTLGSSFNATIENLAGGQIISDQGPAIRTLNGATKITNAGLLSGGNGFALSGGTGNIDFTLQTGSKIIGTANGGGGSNQLTLQGAGLIDNAFTNFQTMYMKGTDWTWAGTGDFHDSFIQTGNFTLQKDLTGNVTVSPGAKLLAGGGFNPSITPYAGGPAITVTNAGVIDLTNGSGAAGDRLTIVGNYVGNNGSLLLNTVLGDDSSASDKLVLSGGTATGTTGIAVTNVGGTGAATVIDGIKVIDAVNGATTAGSAFYLSGRAAAGAYEYFLFKGGVSANTTQNWYLRSEYVTPTPTPDNPTPTGPIIAPTDPATPNVVQPPVPGGQPPEPGATPVTPVVEERGGVSVSVVPLLRPEVATYSALPPAARLATLATLGTFHERRGEQSVLTPGSDLSAAWGRVFGQSIEQGGAGTASPSIDGSIWGFQTGIDILRRQSEGGHRDIAGIFFGYAGMNSDVKGQALGWNNLSTGKIKVDATSVGGYWTHIGPSGWYLDGIVMGTWYGGNARSVSGAGIDNDGSGITVSLEGGYPFALTDNWLLEPQAQLIWQRTWLDNQQDAFSGVSFDSNDAVTGRIGARLQGNYQTARGLFQPYLKANLWHNFKATDTVLFGTDPITTQAESTSLELGGGIVHNFTKNVSAFATADYTFDVSGERKRAFEGNIGLTVKW